jgi:predicted nucleotidyltransferase
MFKEINTLKLFFENPSKKYNVREVARILNINPSTASNYLKDLKENKLLKYKKDKIYDFYQANIDSFDYRDLKIYYSIRKIRCSGLIEEINKFYLKPTIILFGSVSTGYDLEDSDIDLVIISEKQNEFKEKKKFEKILNKKLQLFVVKNLKELKNQHLINNILSGIVLQGEIRWI